MSRKKQSKLFLFSILCLLVAGGAMYATQDPAKPTDTEKLQGRVELLEKRVEQLERVLFSTAKLDTVRAERRLEEAERGLKNAKQLFTDCSRSHSRSVAVKR